MLKSFRVRNFRSFDDFVVENLARVNVFVGGNNSGKTSLLEAAELLLAPDTVDAMTDIPRRRKEDLAGAGIDVSHLFRGHRGELGSKIEIGDPTNSKQRLACEIVAGELEFFNRRRSRRTPEPSTKDPRSTHAIRFSFGDGSETVYLPMTVRDHMLIVEREYTDDRNVPPVRVIGTEAETSTDLWEDIVLTHEETKTIEALQVIEPDIERIAAGSQGFFVRMAHSEQRIPLGSMGDGVRRLLNLAMNLARSAGGTLIVDEIDTGLHHSVMTKMWLLVIETARRLDLQVLATTHSDDCIRSLARLCEEMPDLGGEIALHRVVRGAGSTVRYSAEEIRAASESGIEMRGTN